MQRARAHTQRTPHTTRRTHARYDDGTRTNRRRRWTITTTTTEPGNGTRTTERASWSPRSPSSQFSCAFDGGGGGGGGRRCQPVGLSVVGCCCRSGLPAAADAGSMLCARVLPVSPCFPLPGTTRTRAHSRHAARGHPPHIFDGSETAAGARRHGIGENHGETRIHEQT